MKKEDIYVKLTKKNIDRVISILEERCFKHDLLMAEMYLKHEVFENLYVYCVDRIDGDYWMVSLDEPNKTCIKPKQLREMLSANYEVVVTKPNKQLEIGKWYKFPPLGEGRLMFKFNGKFGDAVAIGFGSDGEFAKIIGVHKECINRYEEATPEEVVKAFEYHFENFYE